MEGGGQRPAPPPDKSSPVRQAPVDNASTRFQEGSIRSRKRSAPKEASMGTERRRVGRFDHIVTVRVNKRFFLLSKRPPQNEYDSIFLVVNQTDDLVSEGLPAAVPM